MTGQKEEPGIDLLFYPQGMLSVNKNKGFSFVEITVVIAISMVMFGAIFMVWNSGEHTSSIGRASIDLQREVRMAMDWMIKDLRQTTGTVMLVTDSLGNPNQPYPTILPGNTFSDPQFPLCDGYDVPTSSRKWGDQILYTFDAGNNRLIRTNLSTVPMTRIFFNHINNLVFTFLTFRTMRIDISGQIIARRGTPATGNIVRNVALREEVKFRNE